MLAELVDRAVEQRLGLGVEAHDLEEELLLRAEVADHESRIHARVGRDVAHRGARVATQGEERGGSVADRLPAGVARRGHAATLRRRIASGDEHDSG